MWTTRTKLGWGDMVAGVLLLVLFSARDFTLDPEVYNLRQRAVYEALTQKDDGHDCAHSPPAWCS